MLLQHPLLLQPAGIAYGFHLLSYASLWPDAYRTASIAARRYNHHAAAIAMQVLFDVAKQHLAP